MKVVDTTVLVDVLRDVPEAVAKVREIEERDTIAATEIGTYEMHVGIGRLGPRRRAVEELRVRDLIEHMDVLPFDRHGAIRAAEIAETLRKRGRSIGILDLFTAAIALGHGASALVTRNRAEFERIPGIAVETY